MGTPTRPSMSPITRSTSPCEFINNKSSSRWKWHVREATFQFAFVRTPKKIMKDASPFCGIQMVFLFEPETIFAEMTMVDDLLANWDLMISLKLQKKNQTKMKDGRWLSSDKSRCLLEFLFSIPSRRSLKSFFEVVTSLSTIVTSFESSTIS